MSNVALLVDATNLTIQFPRPEGLIDYYTVEYTLLKPPPQPDQNQTSIAAVWGKSGSEIFSSITKNFTDSGYSSSSSGAVIVNLSLEDLIAGAGYALHIRTCSHLMYSDPIHLEAHTSECFTSYKILLYFY